MSQTMEVINIGALPNDGSGDPLRVAFQKINNNFALLGNTGWATYETSTVGNTQGQIIFSTAANTFTQGIFQINTMNPATQDSQNITLNIAKTNNGSNVRWTGHSTLFNGSYLTQYDCDITGPNVNIRINPLTNASLNHFMTYLITYTVTEGSNVEIALDGYVANTLMSTENNEIIEAQGI